jgi:hypothetical protein
MKVHKLIPIVALTILAAIAAAAPITIPGLFSTGTAGEGALDPYYWLAASPYGPLSVYGVITDGFPIPPWIANNSSSRWISPTADASNDLVRLLHLPHHLQFDRLPAEHCRDRRSVVLR